ncbi:CRAL-TRIO domain-containing protein [Aspergillus nidulans var. acristatus]
MTVPNGNEASAASAFTKLCADKGLLKRPLGLKDEDVADGFTDEMTLLRFLQANKLDSSKALEQFQQALDFHTDNDAIRLYDLISVSEFEETRAVYPHWTGRCDRSGRPLLMFNVSAIDKEGLAHWRKTRDMPKAIIPGYPADADSTVSASTWTSTSPPQSPNMAQRAVAYFDYYSRFVLPLCSAAHGKPVTNCVYLIDAGPLYMRQAWDLREFARDVSWILAMCFPETIYRCYCCNVPSFLARFWTIFKSFIDPVTASKVQFLPRSDAYDTLKADIEHDDIPTCLGGGFQFETGMLPDLDDGIRRALEWSGTQVDLPPGPIKWVQTPAPAESGTGTRKAVATGTVEGVQRAVEVATLRAPVSSSDA